MKRGARQGTGGATPPPGDAVASSRCGHAFTCRDRGFNKLLLEAAGNEFAAASEWTAAGPRLDSKEARKVAAMSADTHPGVPVVLEGIGVPGTPIADEAAAAAARAGA